MRKYLFLLLLLTSCRHSVYEFCDSRIVNTGVNQLGPFFEVLDSSGTTKFRAYESEWEYFKLGDSIKCK